MVTSALIKGGARRRAKPRRASGDLAFYLIINIVMALTVLSMLYPLLYILSSSFSSTDAVRSGSVVLLPVGFNMSSYRSVFTNENILTGFSNSFFYTLAGTLVNVAMTMVFAYPLSRSDTPFRKPVMLMLTFTMFFGGGLVPNYILMNYLGLINNRMVMILPGMINVYNLIIARTFIQRIPSELREAAEIDGCSDAHYFFRVIVPLSGTCMAVLALYYAVAHWNEYFSALIYINDRTKYPLQLFLREILISTESLDEMRLPDDILEKHEEMAALLKYAVIVVSTVPVLFFYPFAQKYFIQGVTVGSLKG